MSDTMIKYGKPSRAAKIAREEKELEDLLKQAQEPEEEEQQEEEQEEEEPKVTEKKEEETPEVKEETDEDETLTKEEKTFKKRYGDLRRHSQKVEKELREEIDKLKTTSTKVTAPTSDEDLEDWAKKYPEVASIVMTIAEKKANEKFAAAEDRLSKIDELQNEANRKSAEAKILEVHSDFLSIRDSDEFHDWAEEQAKWVQDALYENEDDPKSVIAVVDLFKFKTGKTPTDKKESRKSAATSVKSKATQPDATLSGKKIRESEVARPDYDYEANEEAIMEAIRTGNFIYDITGGAR